MPRRKNKRAHVQSPCFRIRRGDIFLADLGTKADIIGIIAGIALFKSGHFIWALICLVIGIGTNIGMLAGEFSGGGSGYHDEECPYCGSGDTVGNHCYNCDDDF